MNVCLSVTRNAPLDRPTDFDEIRRRDRIAFRGRTRDDFYPEIQPLRLADSGDVGFSEYITIDFTVTS